MDINIPFKIEFLTIKTNNFKDKKKAILQELKKYPEKRFHNFFSNRDKTGLADVVANVFQEEFLQISEHYKSNIDLYSAWSATYGKGDYHVPHNHGSTGYCGILYLNMQKKSPTTCYMQPWNCDRDRSIIYEPKAEAGDMVIVPQFIVHFTRPNPLPFKKRIISFDFRLQ